jgi:periplasmic divalent cation tolerance protein
MQNVGITLLYSPFPGIESARPTAAALLESGLVACCNLLPGAESHYIWNGEPTTAQEIILIAKTTAGAADAAAARLEALHPYECPAILRFEAGANAAFAAWVAGAVQT